MKQQLFNMLVSGVTLLPTISVPSLFFKRLIFKKSVFLKGRLTEKEREKSKRKKEQELGCWFISELIAIVVYG